MMRLAVFLIFLATSGWAINPSEMLPDPVQEARAQALDDLIRCVKCRSESIASSNADWANDARLRVRRMISEGASDQDVLDAFVASYGDVVLMRPPAEGRNLVLWLSGPVMLFLALAMALRFQRQEKETAAPLSDDEIAQLDRIRASD